MATKYNKMGSPSRDITVYVDSRDRVSGTSADYIVNLARGGIKNPSRIKFTKADIPHPPFNVDSQNDRFHFSQILTSADTDLQNDSDYDPNVHTLPITLDFEMRITHGLYSLTELLDEMQSIAPFSRCVNFPRQRMRSSINFDTASGKRVTVRSVDTTHEFAIDSTQPNSVARSLGYSVMSVPTRSIAITRGSASDPADNHKIRLVTDGGHGLQLTNAFPADLGDVSGTATPVTDGTIDFEPTAPYAEVQPAFDEPRSLVRTDCFSYTASDDANLTSSNIVYVDLLINENIRLERSEEDVVSTGSANDLNIFGSVTISEFDVRGERPVKNVPVLKSLRVRLTNHDNTTIDMGAAEHRLVLTVTGASIVQ
jgi:hypothetical protein